MSLVLDILNTLADFEIKYKGVRVNILGIPQFSNKNKGYLSLSVYRLKQKGLLNRTKAGYKITSKGKSYLTTRSELLKSFSATKNGKPKDLLVIFDIPENQKTKRDWFRFQLKKLDFIIIQKSVWIGPSPLPKDFLDYVEEIGIRRTFKTFKLSKPYK